MRTRAARRLRAAGRAIGLGLDALLIAALAASALVPLLRWIGP